MIITWTILYAINAHMVSRYDDATYVLLFLGMLLDSWGLGYILVRLL